MFFLFHVKGSFRSVDIYIFVLTFCLYRRRPYKTAMVDLKTYDVRDWRTNNYNTDIAQYLKK